MKVFYIFVFRRVKSYRFVFHDIEFRLFRFKYVMKLYIYGLDVIYLHLIFFIPFQVFSTQ